ncbi:MAG: nitroreductase family protein [Fusicatenibacter sp.]
MNILETIKQRHSVRQYKDRKIEPEKREQLLNELDTINREAHLHIQILFDEPRCFQSLMAHYGKFSGVQNYIALVGKKSPDLEEKCGYYGERLVLLAQSLGLNTCWVAMTHGKSAARIFKGEKQTCLIALGYGKTQGVAHKSKAIEEVVDLNGSMPEWFKTGIESVLLAPTAMNQQKFCFTLSGEEVSAHITGGFLAKKNSGKSGDFIRAFPGGTGLYTKTDLGIVKYHFEAVTGKKVL